MTEQGLGKYCDPDFVRTASKEMFDALEMSSDEIERAAHNIISTSHEVLGQEAKENSNVIPRTAVQRSTSSGLADRKVGGAGSGHPLIHRRLSPV